jgi:PKD repeat protein
MKKLLNAFMLLGGLVILMSSCNKEVLPVADFIYTVDGLTVTFENASEEATSYSWDFGDGASSTETNPTHTYAEEGSFTVTLTATNEDGEDTRSENIAVAKPSIIVDGNFDDWAEYETFYAGPSGSLLEAKVTAKNGFMFFYFRATAADAGPAIQVYFDKDNDGSTGWGFWDAYETPGLEYLLEFVIESFEGVWGPAEPGSSIFVADEEDWPWNSYLVESDAVTESSGWVTVGSEKMLEFSVAQSLMPDLGPVIRLCFQNSNNDWEEAGTLPATWQDPLNTLKEFTF